MQSDATMIEERTARRAAVEADCDVRTVRKVLRGEPVKGTAGERARAALLALGVEVPSAPRWTPPTRRTRP